MKPSRFNIATPFGTEPGDVLMYNTLTEALAVLDADTVELFRRLEERDGRSGIPDSAYADLAEEGFVVPGDADEEAAARLWFQRGNHDYDGYFHATIINTLCCNLACPYCIEKGVQTDETMTLETAETICDWILAEAEEQESTRGIVLGFYGGEPLMNLPLIRHFGQRMNESCASRGWQYHFALVTNGTLLTREVAEELVPLGLYGARITVDGPREHHDRSRPFKGGDQSSFDTIIGNLDATAGLIDITLSGNYTPHSVETIRSLLEDLDGRGLLTRMRQFSFSPVCPYMDEQYRAYGELPEEHLPPREEAEEHLAIQRELRARGLSQEGPLLGYLSCGMFRDVGHVAFWPDGTIYPCTVLAGHRDLAIGHASQPGLNHRHAELVTLDRWEPCLAETDCPYVTMCGGGCPMVAQVAEGDYRRTYCRRAYYDAVVPELMKVTAEQLTDEETARATETAGQAAPARAS